MEAPSCKARTKMVDQQGGHLWNGQRATLLGTNGGPPPQNPLPYFGLETMMAEPLACSILLFLVAFGCALSWVQTALLKDGLNKLGSDWSWQFFAD